MLSNESESFFMFLTSESNLDTHPENKPGNFTTEFEKTIELNGNYECSLFDIIIPKPNPIVSFNIHLCCIKNEEKRKSTNYENKIIKTEFMIQTLNNKPELVGKFIKISNEMFDDWTVIEKFIRRNYAEYNQQPLIYDKGEIFYQGGTTSFNQNPVHLVMNLGIVHIGRASIVNRMHRNQGFQIFLLFDKNLCHFLNIDKSYSFKEGTVDPIKFNSKLEIVLGKPVTYENILIIIPQPTKPIKDLIEGISTLKSIDFYITTNFIRETYINDVKFSLLRQVHIDDEGKSKYQFEPPIYYPVIFENLNSVKFKFIDKGSSDIIFEKGSSIIILHFRKIK